ncbi:MAG: zinc-dependent alcohol dehydrogenase family protein [Saccharothrix sp.]|nr:zinc-dependent alcohol dehydrogenase family protein [Saccharothrix sp.]
MPRVVVFDEFGGPDVLQVVEDPLPEPAPGEVRVRIEAFAVNPLDRMMRSGTSPAPVPLPRARLGVEGTGIVDALGPGVTTVEVGTPVILTAVPDATTRGTYAEYTTIPASRVIPRPSGLGVTEAAATWVAFSTAYGALVEKAGMRPGDNVLITAATGSVGRAAIQIANHIGATPIALTRNTTKKNALPTAAAVIATDQEDVTKAVHHHTNGTGADIVLDVVMGPAQQTLLNSTRPGGTLVAAGFLDPRPTPFPAGPPITIHSYRSFEHTLDPVVVKRMAAFLNAGIRQGTLHPTIDSVHTLDTITQAHHHLEEGSPTGKIVITT